MNLDDVLANITAFKESHPTSNFSLKVERVMDLDDKYGDLYILAHDESVETDAIDDELLISIEEPSNADIEQLEEIAVSLEKFL